MRLVTVFSLLASLLPVGVLASGLEHVKQTIYGMDCAPCAYGIEQGLKSLSGIEHVTVSLNDGYAEVRLGEESQTTLADIREVIRKNGFAPKNADVQVSGTVVPSSGGQFLLKTDVEIFELKIDEQALRSQLSERADTIVIVSGFVAADDSRQLSVTAIE